MVNREKEFISELPDYIYNLDYWNPDKFDWKEYSITLCMDFSDYFDVW